MHYFNRLYYFNILFSDHFVFLLNIYEKHWNIDSTHSTFIIKNAHAHQLIKHF